MLMLSIILACVNEAEKTNIQKSETQDTSADTADTGTTEEMDVCTQES